MDRFMVLAISICFVGCSANKNNYRCALGAQNFPKFGQNSRVIEFKRIAIMDTITAVVEGKIVTINGSEPLPSAIVRLSNALNKWEVISDSLGQFKFYHISSGAYRLNSSNAGYRDLIKDSLYLGEGAVAQLIIGMGAIGQDDLKKIGKTE